MTRPSGGGDGESMATAKRTAELIRLFEERAPIARFFGMHLSYNEEGGAVVDLPYNPNLDHALGGVHGGVYATMLDTAGWFTAAATTDRSCWAPTSGFTVHLLQPVQRAPLRSLGESREGRQATGRRGDATRGR